MGLLEFETSLGYTVVQASQGHIMRCVSNKEKTDQVKRQTDKQKNTPPPLLPKNPQAFYKYFTEYLFNLLLFLISSSLGCGFFLGCGGLFGLPCFPPRQGFSVYSSLSWNFLVDQANL